MVQDNESHSAEWLHSGIALLDDGRFVTGAVGGGAIVIHDERTHTATVVPLRLSAAHGVTVARSAQGERLWIADPGPEEGTGQVFEVSLSGRILSRVPAPLAAEGEWRPTSVVAVADGSERGVLWIADGYGRNRVYRLTPDSGADVIDAADGIPFDCPHGLAVDTRSDPPRLVVADRGNRRIVFLHLDGSLDRVVADQKLTSPSCIAVRGDHLVVTDLYGAVVTVDPNDRVEIRAGYTPEVGRAGWPNRVVDGEVVPPVLNDRELNSPHGVAVAESGAVYVTEWLLGGRVVRLDWRR
ncbi:hypothetical protein [Frondihabitans sucicola]|uniref:hypothetical protein n=1 Tax=Frondihabitans sucicola TaxID=1268041 RepID=UPI0025739899|nr:hypothetical protein [Frondihabitans sucicola]